MKTAAAYLRVSDERQDEFSPDSQLKLIKDYCAKNDITLPDELIFYDDGISAKSTKKRKQFNEMIALAKQKEKPFQIILVWKFSRFARNQEESIVYKSLLRKNGVEVISVSEPIQDNPFGGLIERIIEWMDEYYLIRLSDEVRRGMTERATRGLPNVAPPYGYKMGNGNYVVDEEQAEIVREIFTLFASGWATRTIATHLLARGIKNREGNPFDNRGIEYILQNPCYIGKLRWNPHGRSASKRNFDNPDDILTTGSHTPIVEEFLYNKVSEIFAQRKKRGVKYAREDTSNLPYMLRGIVRCHTCGSTLCYNKANGTMQCHSYSRGTCAVSHGINVDRLNEMVILELKRCVGELDFRIANSRTPAPLGPPIVNYDGLISAEKLKLERAKQAYREGVDSLEEYKIAKAQIGEKIDGLIRQKEKAAQKENGIDLRRFAQTVTEVINLLEAPSASEDLKNEALKTIVQKIIFYKPDKHIEIHFYI